MIRALLFDLDNTLLDRAGAFRRFASALVKRKVAPDFRRGVLNKLIVVDRANQHRELKEHAVEVVKHTPELGMSADEFYAAYVPGLIDAIEPAPEICAMLKRLAEKWKIALVTNGGSQRQRAKLRRAGLQDCFAPEAIFISAEIGAAKPDPLMFQRPLSWAQCPPENALFIGDDPVCDVDGAAALGIATCWVFGVHGHKVFPKSLNSPDWQINNVLELEGILNLKARASQNSGAELNCA